MKTKLIISLFLLLAVSIIAQQQRPRRGIEQFDVNTVLTRLNEKLSLTDEQVEKIEPILFQTELKLKELKSNNYDDDSEMMEDHKTVMEENAELIEEQLTDEQIEIFREVREQGQKLNNGERPRLGRNRR